jgi:hypothetical protein
MRFEPSLDGRQYNEALLKRQPTVAPTQSPRESPKAFVYRLPTARTAAHPPVDAAAPLRRAHPSSADTRLPAQQATSRGCAKPSIAEFAMQITAAKALPTTQANQK